MHRSAPSAAVTALIRSGSDPPPGICLLLTRLFYSIAFLSKILIFHLSKLLTIALLLLSLYFQGLKHVLLPQISLFSPAFG